MSLPPTLESLFRYIDDHSAEYIENLREAVTIQSVSAWPQKRGDVIKMVEWTERKLKNLGAKTELKDIGTQGNKAKPKKQRDQSYIRRKGTKWTEERKKHQSEKMKEYWRKKKATLADNSTIPLPPVLLADLGEDPSKKTVLVYGHLDVQPALKSDGWDSEPFELAEKDGKLIGRGATDDKGPVLGWIHALQAFKALKMEFPVNLKFIFEGMEESGSVGLDGLIHSLKDTFLKNVDYVVISDNYWLGKNKPCLTYGLRGVCYFFVEVKCAEKDLHSGVYGGCLYEGMPDLIYLLNSLVNKEGEILVEGIMDDVAPVTDEENSLYENITFNVQDFKSEIGTSLLRHGEDTRKLLMHRWRNPSLSIHGIEGAFSDPGEKTVIPNKVIGKFSIRIVPNQVPKKVEECVVKYLQKKWKERGSPNKMKVFMNNGSKAWVSDPNHKNYSAGEKATEHVYKTKPDFTREGGSIPVTLTLEEATGKNVLLLPMGAADDGAHSQNEKINVKNYIEGTKLLGAYLYEVAKM